MHVLRSRIIGRLLLKRLRVNYYPSDKPLRTMFTRPFEHVASFVWRSERRLNVASVQNIQTSVYLCESGPLSRWLLCSEIFVLRIILCQCHEKCWPKLRHRSTVLTAVWRRTCECSGVSTSDTRRYC